MSDFIVLRVRFDDDVDAKNHNGDACADVFAEQLTEVLLTQAEGGGAWGWIDAHVVGVEQFTETLA